MSKSHQAMLNFTLAAMFLAIGMVLPLLTGQIPQIGSMLLPMHIPVLLCGLICGWKYGGVVGFITPLMRHMIFGLPPMPGAVSMAFELATYGIVVGMLYSASKWKCVKSLYRSMLAAMIAGRLVWGIVQAILMGIGGNAFTLKMFLTSALLNAIPGILLQLIIIPAIMVALNRAKLVPFGREQETGKVKAGEGNR